MSQNIVNRGIDNTTGKETVIKATSNGLHTVIVDENGPIDLNDLLPSSTGVTGLKAVTTANTPEQITATSTPIKRVVIQAKSGNVGTIVIGFSNAVRASPAASINGIDLQAGDAYTVDINNLNKVWIDASINGEAVTYHYSV
jgi:hypothetical protein